MHKVRSSPRKVKQTSNKTTPPATPSNEIACNEDMSTKGKTNPTKRKKILRSFGKKIAAEQEIANDLSSFYESPTMEDDETKISETNSTLSSSSLDVSHDNSLYQPVGQQLLEQLDKGKKKRGTNGKPSKRPPVPLKVCSGCGTTALATRAKKCHSCGQLYTTSSSSKRHSNDPCPHCNQVPKVGRGARPTHCPNCQKPLVETEDSLSEESSSQSLLYETSYKEIDSEAAAIIPDLATTATKQLTDGFSSSPVSHSVGYVPSLAPPSEPDTLEKSDSETPSGNVELKKLLKRKFLNSATSNSEPPGKKLHLDCSTEDTPTSHTGSPPPSLPVSLPSSLMQHSAAPPPSSIESVSSPLLEYAQKISARVMIPPEISPQSSRKAIKPPKRSNKTSKGNKVKQSKELATTPLKSERPTSPISPTTTAVADSVDKSPVAPPPLQSDEVLLDSTGGSGPQLSGSTSLLPVPASSSSFGYSFDSRASLADPVSMATTKPHDPTINSIRSFSHSFFSSSPSLTPPIYAQPAAPPPLIPPTISSPSFYSHSHDELYSLNKPPPLVPVSTWTPLLPKPDTPPTTWYCSTENQQPVAHRTVIVDPKPKDVISMATASAPPSITTEATEDEVTDDTQLTEVTDMEKDVVQLQDDSVSMKEKVHKSHTHSKRKQKLMLSSETAMSQDDEELSEIKKKKKKKKKKEREKGEKGHHSSKHRDPSDKASDKKMKKKKKKKDKDKESASQTEDEDLPTVGKTEDNEEIPNSQEVPDSQDSQDYLFSVKISDLTVHRLNWDKYTMTLLVPLAPNETPMEVTPIKQREATPVDTPTQIAGGGSQEELTPGETRTLRSGKRRLRESSQTTAEERDELDLTDDDGVRSLKKKRKSRVKQENEKLNNEVVKYEEGSQKDCNEVDDVMETYNISPSFSVFELRNKLFSDFPPRTVHAFTYKLKIKTHRPPLHWIHVLKRVGGLPDSCHTCRLLNVEAVKQLCELNKMEIPSSIDKLLNNDLGNRKLIDLSNNDPATIVSKPEILHYNIPLCSFNDSLPRKKSTRQQVAYHKFLTQQELAQKEIKSSVDDREGIDEEEIEEQENEEKEDEEDEEIEQEKSNKSRSAKKPPPQLLSTDNDSQKFSGGRKKPCTHCGVMVLCKSKKCRNCGKLFGVFTFGRRVCINCGHINLARMSSCFKCSTPLDKAPTAKPKDVDPHFAQKSDQMDSIDYRTSKVDFKFGVRKRRRFHTGGTAGHSNLVNTSPSSHTKQDPSAAHDNDDILNDYIDSPPPPSHDRKRGNRKDQQLIGYQYGKIPWSDADLALLITTTGIPKFCLQEVCNKVLRYHNKTDVFEMVKNLHLQLEQGSGILLRKLQALGLHPNRSPICKLITSEDLFALMDALEEPVPEEVHQHLESVSLNTSPLSPSSPQGSSLHNSAAPLLSSFNGVPLVSSLVEEEAENEFESTLHEVKCSDGQSLSMLRAWDGTHFLCLLEVWRRYFPEVNRSHLSAVIKKMCVETQIPTSQQTNLLRAANVISMRGAPGRLIKLQDVQRLLDDFGIPLQIGADLDKTPEKIPISFKPPPRRFYPRYNMGRSSAEATRRNDLANCMDILLDVLQPSDLTESLLANQQVFQKDVTVLDKEINSLSFKLDLLKNALYGGRDLCQTLCDEIGFLTVANHSHMAEIVRLDRDLSQSLQEIDLLIDHSTLQTLIEL